MIDGPAVFQIKSFRQSYLISARSPKEKEEWMQTIHHTREALYQGNNLCHSQNVTPTSLFSSLSSYEGASRGSTCVSLD